MARVSFGIRPATLLAILSLAGAGSSPVAADTAADYAALTSGATNFPINCCPGNVTVYGKLAFPVLVEPTGNRLVLEAAGYLNDNPAAARAVAFGHDQWGTASDARILMVEKAVLWASRKATPASITIGLGPALNGTYFSSRGFVVKNVSTSMSSSANDLSGCDVFVAHWHQGYTAGAVTKIVNFAAGGGGVVMLATPWALSAQQAADGQTVLGPFGLSWSGSIPQDYGFTNVLTSPYSVNYSAIPAATNLLADHQGTASMSATEKSIAAGAIEHVLAVRDDIAELNGYVGQLSAAYSWIAPTRAAPITPATQPVEAMLARYQSRQFDKIAPGSLFVHPAASDWPGLPAAGPTVTRTLVINGTTHPSDFYMNQGTRPTRRETRLYAPPGGNVTVTIPAGLTGAGWQAHIGGTQDDAFNLDTWRNFPRIWRRVSLTNTTTSIGHVFGGLITLLVPVNSSAGPVSVTISNAVEAPVFDLAVDDNAAWNSSLKWKPGAWGYLQTSNLVIYLPRWQLTNVTDMAAIAGHWASVMWTADQYYGYGPYRKRAEVMASDRQVSAGAAYAGYPIELGWAGDTETELQTTLRSGNWGSYHELGHGFQDNFDGAFGIATGGEVDVNLFPGLMLLKLHDQTSWEFSGDYYGATARTSKRATFLALPAAQQTWDRACSIYDAAGSCYDFYYNLSDAFGWEVYRTAFTRLMNWLQGGADAELSALSSSDPNYKRNRFYLLFCDAAQRNLDAYFQRYGLGVSGLGYDISASTKSLIAAKGYPVWTDNRPPTSLSSPGSLNISEAAAVGSAIYTYSATDPEPGTVFTYAIAEGNDGSFSLDKRTGTLRVGPRGLDFERTNTHTLKVIVSDNGVPRFFLTNTMTVHVQNAPESPWIEASLLQASNATVAGAVLGAIPARLDTGTTAANFFSVSGNAGGLFSLNSANGNITRSATGTLPNPGLVEWIVGVRDSAGRVGYGTVRILCNAQRGLLEERWTGQNVFSGPTAYTGLLPSFDTPADVGDNYSRRLSGYLIPPQTGDYTFWVASDDASTLYLSSDVNPAHKVELAGVSSWTSQRAFDQYASQKSAPVPLIAGKSYYIEGRQVEGAGGDHLSAAWSSDAFARAIIPGSVLVPNLAGIQFSTAAPPTAVTGPANPLGPTSVRLTAQVNAGGGATWVVFEWGLTTAYGNATTLQSAGSGAVGVDVTADLSGLTFGQTYHARVVAVNSAGTTLGADVAFTSSIATPHITGVLLPPGGGLRISGTGSPGVNQALEASSNFVAWNWRAHVPPDPAGLWQFLETDISTQPHRFYRVVAAPQWPSGLVTWYRAESNYVDSFGPNHGAPEGMMGFAAGRLGAAFRFGTTNDAIFAGGTAVPVPWTLALWVRRQDSPQLSAALCGDTQGAIKIEQFPGTRKVGFTQFGVADYAFNYSLPTNQWTHLALVGDAGGTTLYINGQFIESLAQVIPLPLQTFGRRDTGADHFIGWLDEITVFSRALGAGEIQQVLTGAGGP